MRQYLGEEEEERWVRMQWRAWAENGCRRVRRYGMHRACVVCSAGRELTCIAGHLHTTRRGARQGSDSVVSKGFGQVKALHSLYVGWVKLAKDVGGRGHSEEACQ
jgi:hypothetical protein